MMRWTIADQDYEAEALFEDELSHTSPSFQEQVRKYQAIYRLFRGEQKAREREAS